MATTNVTRHASGARGGARARVLAVVDPDQLTCIAGLPHLDGDGATAVRRFAHSAFGPCTDMPIPQDGCTPALYTLDSCGVRVASPHQILEQAQILISSRFHRGAPLLDQPHLIHALLRARLAAHPRAVFGALFFDRRKRLIEFVEMFNGTVDGVTVYPREVMREAMHRNAEVVLGARNDPTGDAEPSRRDVLSAQMLRRALALIDVPLLDYLIVGETVTSLAERAMM